MSKFNGNIAVVNVQPFTNGSTDKNGLLPVFLSPIAGTMPHKNLLNGTMADNSGLQPFNTYMVQVDELEAHPQHGRQFRFTNLGEVSKIEMLQIKRELGAPKREDENATADEVVVENEATTGEPAV